jgi:hypothetical protein
LALTTHPLAGSNHVYRVSATLGGFVTFSGASDIRINAEI